MKPLSPDEAYTRGAAQCARRETCLHELRQKFVQAGLSMSEADDVLARLEADGYIDEARYARAFVHDKLLYERWGRQKIRHALQQRRLSSSDIDAALAGIDDEVYRQTLRTLLESRQRSLKAADARELRQKLARYAAGRGFELHLIFECLGGDDVCDD